MPDWLVVIILGIVEGITEFLPISSTGHLLLVEHALGTHQTDLFNTVIQCGAVLAVVVIFTARLKELCFQWREPATRDYILKLGVSFVITAVGGLVLKKLNYKLPETPIPVAWATLVGGILFIAIELGLRNRPRTDTITWAVAIGMGIAQLAAAVFPGLSRSGSTILTALAFGLNRPAAAEFSFLLGIPTLLAAGALQTYKALKDPAAAPIDWGLLALGSVVAAVTAFAAVKWLLKFVQGHTFIGFGWYRIVVGGIILLWMGKP